MFKFLPIKQFIKKPMLVLALLLALLGSQFASAQHEVEHFFHDEQASCQVLACLAHSVALDASLQLDYLDRGFFNNLLDGSFRPTLSTLAPFQARAPPTLISA